MEFRFRKCDFFLHYLVGKKYKSTAWQKLKEKSVRQQLEETFNCCEERMKRKNKTEARCKCVSFGDKFKSSKLILIWNSVRQMEYMMYEP